MFGRNKPKSVLEEVNKAEDIVMIAAIEVEQYIPKLKAEKNRKIKQFLSKCSNPHFDAEYLLQSITIDLKKINAFTIFASSLNSLQHRISSFDKLNCIPEDMKGVVATIYFCYNKANFKYTQRVVDILNYRFGENKMARQITSKTSLIDQTVMDAFSEAVPDDIELSRVLNDILSTSPMVQLPPRLEQIRNVMYNTNQEAPSTDPTIAPMTMPGPINNNGLPPPPPPHANVPYPSIPSGIPPFQFSAPPPPPMGSSQFPAPLPPPMGSNQFPAPVNTNQFPAPVNTNQFPAPAPAPSTSTFNAPSAPLPPPSTFNAPSAPLPPPSTFNAPSAPLPPPSTFNAPSAPLSGDSQYPPAVNTNQFPSAPSNLNAPPSDIPQFPSAPSNLGAPPSIPSYTTSGGLPSEMPQFPSAPSNLGAPPSIPSYTTSGDLPSSNLGPAPTVPQFPTSNSGSVPPPTAPSLFPNLDQINSPYNPQGNFPSYPPNNNNNNPNNGVFPSQF